MSVFVPTPQQLDTITQINSEVNNDPRWIGQENFCVPAMAEKMERLQAAGIPLSAMTPVTVDAGPRFGDEAHSLLQISGLTAEGAPWATFLDINEPGLLTRDDLTALGYTIV